MNSSFHPFPPPRILRPRTMSTRPFRHPDSRSVATQAVHAALAQHPELALPVRARCASPFRLSMQLSNGRAQRLAAVVYRAREWVLAAPGGAMTNFPGLDAALDDETGTMAQVLWSVDDAQVEADAIFRAAVRVLAAALSAAEPEPA